MLKLLGSGCVLAAGTLLLYRRLAEQRRKRQLLRELAAALETVGAGVRVSRVAMPRLLQTAAGNGQGEAAAFFVRVQTRSAELGLAEAWRSSVELLSLDAEETAILKEAGNCLAGDEEQVCAGLQSAAGRLRQELERKRAAAADVEKRTAALYLSASALIVILLI